MSRKQKNREEEFEEFWDIKKLLIGIFFIAILIGLGLIAKHFLLADTSVFPQQSIQSFSTQPISSSVSANGDIATEVKKLENQAKNLSLTDIASSSPQVQQIIEQLQALPKMPENTAKNICVQLCNKL
ncbi:MAG TPA: hypothetical protein VGT05_01865 [Patescibacteria group bacterium]|nr:hypothetical protein [Patescibacteria group bacterium]